VVGTKQHPRDPSRLVPVLRGGVRNEEVAEVASWLCPVPGGFGPVMLGVLAVNTVTAAAARCGGCGTNTTAAARRGGGVNTTAVFAASRDADG
jgi:hypothetical protein